MVEQEAQNSVIRFIELHPVIFGGGFTLLGALMTVFLGSKVKSVYLKINKKDKLKQTLTSNNNSSAIQQNTGRDTVINNFYSPVSVGIVKEGIPVIQEMPANDIPDIINVGFSKISSAEKGITFSNENIERLGKFFTQVFEVVGSSRNGLTMLQGAVFALGSKDFENKEWKEHCAASLRELLHHWKGTSGNISRDFNLTFKTKNPDFPTMITSPETYQRLNFYYTYFSEKCHHSPARIYPLRNLYGEDIKDGDDSDEMFFRVVRDFLSELGDFFRAHVK